MAKYFTPDRGLTITDSMMFAIYSFLFLLEIVIVTKYLVPLRIKSPYIFCFYSTLAVLLVSNSLELIARQKDGDAAYVTEETSIFTFGENCRHVGTIAYIMLGFILSAMMF